MAAILGTRAGRRQRAGLGLQMARRAGVRVLPYSARSPSPRVSHGARPKSLDDIACSACSARSTRSPSPPVPDRGPVARARSLMRRLLPLALVALLALTLLPGLAAVDALDEREARDLVTAYESTERREWLSPVYAHEPFFEKPLPGYAPDVLARRFIARLWPDADERMLDVAISRAVRALLA